MVKYYAGIGSRETPQNVLEFLNDLNDFVAKY
jgi:hypothetical protein